MAVDGADDADRDDKPSKSKVGFSGFAALDMTEEAWGVPEDEDFGGLMVRLLQIYR
jgi:hypothetical protein